MLNKKKKILDTGLSTIDKNQSFLKLPSLSKNLFLQHNYTSKKPKSLPFVFQKTDSNNVSFSFSGKTYRTNYYFSSYKKNNNYPKKFYKNNILFLNKVFKEKKKSKFFSLKTVRGGLMITSLGLISFVPKSLVAKSNNKTQRIVNFKLLKKKHNFSFKQDLKVNLVSSLKKT
jgi:hypothetical protein